MRISQLTLTMFCFITRRKMPKSIFPEIGSIFWISSFWAGSPRTRRQTCSANAQNPWTCATELFVTGQYAVWKWLFLNAEPTNIPVMSIIPVPWGSKRSKAVFMSLIWFSVSCTWVLSRPSFSIELPHAAALRELEAWKIKCQFTISLYPSSPEPLKKDEIICTEVFSDQTERQITSLNSKNSPS